MKAQSAQNISAADAYASAQAKAADLLEAIHVALVEHMDKTDPDSRCWGAVGDLGYVNAHLAEVLAFLNGYHSMQDW